MGSTNPRVDQGLRVRSRRVPPRPVSVAFSPLRTPRRGPWDLRWWRTGWMAARWPISHLEPTTVWVSPSSSPQASLLGPRHSQSGQRHTAVHAAKTFTTMPDRRRYRPWSAREGRPARGRAWRRTRMQAGLGRQGRGCARLSEPTAHPSMASALLLLRTSPTPSRHLTPSAAHLHFAHGALWRTHRAKRC